MAIETHYWGNYGSAVVARGKSIGSFGLLVYLQRASVVRWGSNKNMWCNRSEGYSCLCCCWFMSQPWRWAQVVTYKELKWKSIKNNEVSAVATVCILLLMITFWSYSFCHTPLIPDEPPVSLPSLAHLSIRFWPMRRVIHIEQHVVGILKDCMGVLLCWLKILLYSQILLQTDTTVVA